MGKTNAARIPAAAAALDPHTRLVIADGKGGKDFEPLTQVAHFYVSGVRAAAVEALVQVLTDAVEDMNARFERMARLPDDICPEGKVTPQITRRTSYGMPLTVILVDEVHRYLEHPDHGKTIHGLLTELAKAGPAAGYILIARHPAPRHQDHARGPPGPDRHPLRPADHELAGLGDHPRRRHLHRRPGLLEVPPHPPRRRHPAGLR